jgi:hypothetical protein
MEAIMPATMAQNVLDANRDFIMSKELEILQTALEEKAYTWPAIQAIAAQYGHEWDSLGFTDKPEPTSASGLKRLIKEYSATSEGESTPEGLTEPLDAINDAGELVTEGVTIIPGEGDRQWYEYRRADGSTFRSYDRL